MLFCSIGPMCLIACSNESLAFSIRLNLCIFKSKVDRAGLVLCGVNFKLYENDPNGACCQVAHINRRDRKLKGQGPKTGSGSTNQSISGPFLALGMVFLPGFRCSACPVWGGRSWLQTPLNGSVIRLGLGLVSRCRARHFCRVDHTSHPVVTLVRGGKQHVILSNYFFIFSCL